MTNDHDETPAEPRTPKSDGGRSDAQTEADVPDAAPPSSATTSQNQDQDQEQEPVMADDDDDIGYGLPTPRNEETGELEADEHEYTFNGDDYRMLLIPPTLDQIESYQSLGDDPDMDKLREIIERHIVKPDVPAGDLTIRDINCLVNGIVDYGGDGGGEKMEQIRQAIEEREGRAKSEGN